MHQTILSAELSIGPLNKVAYTLRDVIGAQPQWRDRYRECVEPVEEVFPESPILNLRLSHEHGPVQYFACAAQPTW